MNKIFLVLFCLLFKKVRASYSKEITTTVDAGRKDCFYHHVKLGQIIDIDYQVIDGGHGDLDVSFELFDPMKKMVYADYKKPDNIHRHEAKISGDYSFCFDNTFSTFNKKTIFFELIVEKDDDEEDKWKNVFEGLRPEEVYDMKVQEIQESIVRIKTHLTRARQLQDVLRSYEARDRNVAEENYLKVNAWSFFQIITMFVVGTLQVIMVKSLFDTKSNVHRIWKKTLLVH
ncbi:transmembrane emp24 domain-containing protein 5-like [Lutzomyia longipalpis]|uniref:transmembrane emp24 domain-containing protein 5-like n=1 Tax=Lutzomyia longipalpis TaxID=7200 RepID=UPI00248368F2|nr:transmembrane emp24 domain-containing protein 5-like [Lutzomyia longipalpis]